MIPTSLVRTFNIEFKIIRKNIFFLWCHIKFAKKSQKMSTYLLEALKSYSVTKSSAYAFLTVVWLCPVRVFSVRGKAEFDLVRSPFLVNLSASMTISDEMNEAQE